MATIEQFMWQWQPHFRISVQVTAERSLELAGAHLDPQVMLVGFALDPGAVQYPICIEPEDGPLGLEHIQGVAQRAEEIYEADPERQILTSDRNLQESRDRWLLRHSRGAALAEAIEASGTMPGKRLFVSSAGEVAGFEVHTCLAVDREPLDALPHLDGEDVNRFPAPSSFILHLIQRILIEADAALAQRDPSMGAIRPSAEDLVNRTSEAFVMGSSFRSRNFVSPASCRWFDAIARRPYEGSSVVGRLLLVEPDQPQLTVAVKFERPTSLSSARAVRKLLELCSEDLALLVHENGVFGLGSVVPPWGPRIFQIDFVSHATWELATDSDVLLRRSYGEAALAEPAFDPAVLVDTLGRALGDGANLQGLAGLVEAATRARHGTTLVVSADAPGEAKRLSGQSTVIEPIELTPDLLSHLAEIDGAVLVDHGGVCHAIGVILDGAAAAKGDPSRGARYNSAVKYVDSALAASVVVVVSEDGDVMQVPEMKPRIRRQEVIDALTTLEAAVLADRPAAFSDAFADVRRLAFYLTAEQCDRVNELTRAERDRTIESGAIAIVRPDLTPNPEMNDSYFLE